LSRSQAKADAFVALLQPLQRPLEVYCRRMLRNPDWAEDVIQAAVAAAYARFDRFAEGTNFRAWMFRFVTHEVFNRNRKREPISLHDAPADLAAEESWGLVTNEATFEALRKEPDVVLEHFDDVVAEALGRLPSAERAVLLLRAIGDLSYQEIHEVLSVPLGSVIGYLSRGRQRLRIALADYAAEQGLFRRPLSEGPQP
jgi:RNA polymerase sigma-70 factor (ECF subfamily)